MADAFFQRPKGRGNFRMCKHPTNPLKYLRDKLRTSSVFRFILTHPDMDHMDGLARLLSEFEVVNFWDSGVRKSKPDFAGSPYLEEDWNAYESLISGARTDITVIQPEAGSTGKYWNSDDEGGKGDNIEICGPNSQLVQEANLSETATKINDASYMIAFQTPAGNIIFPGDARDRAWESAVATFQGILENCRFLLAPHHGRQSEADFSFLSHLNPSMSVLGCAPSENLAYAAWNSRKLPFVTKNQTGNICLYASPDGLAVYVENDSFAEKITGSIGNTDEYGYFFLGTLVT